MAKVDDRNNVKALQFTERDADERPVVALMTNPGAMDGGAVTEKPDIELLEKLEVSPPILIVTAPVHLIDAHGAVLNRRIAVLRRTATPS
jgi:hypothetical protein